MSNKIFLVPPGATEDGQGGTQIASFIEGMRGLWPDCRVQTSQSGVYAAEVEVPAAFDTRHDFSVYIETGLSTVVVDGSAEDAYDVLTLLFPVVGSQSIDVFTESYDVHFAASDAVDSSEFCASF